MTFTKPMLAAPLLSPDAEHTDDSIFAAMKQLKFPVAATLKRDGIRAMRLNGTLLSRTLKRIPNKAICQRAIVLPGGIDMELWNKKLDYCDVESRVMSRVHPDSDKIQFHILDYYGVATSYVERCDIICRMMMALPLELHDSVKFSPPMMCENAEQLFAFFRMCEDQAGEGICFRLPNSPYKMGRSTLKEQYLVKLCRNVTAEAVITGFVEQQENGNACKYNAVGSMDRSSHQDGMIGKDTLGAFLVVDMENEINFSIGTGIGLTDEFRREIWRNQDEYLGLTITYKCKAHGKKVKPRSPIFKGFRNFIDI